MDSETLDRLDRLEDKVVATVRGEIGTVHERLNGMHDEISTLRERVAKVELSQTSFVDSQAARCGIESKRLSAVVSAVDKIALKDRDSKTRSRVAWSIVGGLGTILGALGTAVSVLGFDRLASWFHSHLVEHGPKVIDHVQKVK